MSDLEIPKIYEHLAEVLNEMRGMPEYAQEFSCKAVSEIYERMHEEYRGFVTSGGHSLHGYVNGMVSAYENRREQRDKRTTAGPRIECVPNKKETYRFVEG